MCRLADSKLLTITDEEEWKFVKGHLKPGNPLQHMSGTCNYLLTESEVCVRNIRLRPPCFTDWAKARSVRQGISRSRLVSIFIYGIF